MKYLKILNKYDYFLMIIFILMFIFLFVVFSNDHELGKTVSIYVDGQLYQELPLDVDATVVIDDGKHENTIVIENGQVYISEANCPDGICLRASPISRSNELIVCLPNKVYVEINGDGEDEIDGYVN